MSLYKYRQRIRNTVSNSQIQRRREEHTDRGHQDTIDEPNLNIQSRMTSYSDDNSCPQESEISMELANRGSEIQTSPNIASSRSPINS
ncbi:hypothetical protein ACP70R_006368 [Stipagrostis hirtigluma subsp. patula]